MLTKPSIEENNAGLAAGQKKSLLSVRQAAGYLNISTRTIKRYMSARRISFVKIFGQYRFRLEDLDKFIIDNRIPSLAEQKSKISFPAEKIRN